MALQLMTSAPGPVSAEQHAVQSQLVALLCDRALLALAALTTMAETIGQVPNLPPDTLDRLTAIMNNHNIKAAQIDGVMMPCLSQHDELAWQAQATQPGHRVKL